MSVTMSVDGPVLVVTIDRPEVRNAVDGPTATALATAFRDFAADDGLAVAVLTGAAGTFCSGADLAAMTTGRGNRLSDDMSEDGPLGPTRMTLSKPVIAAVEGFAVAGGLELALWCDLRVAANDAVFGVYCRRWGVPLVDGGTIRLPRLIGQSHASDLVLTGRGVSGDEAQRMGLANRLTEPGGRTGAFGADGARPGRPSPDVPAERPSIEHRTVEPVDGRCARQRDPARPGHGDVTGLRRRSGPVRGRRGTPRLVRPRPRRVHQRSVRQVVP